MTIGKQSILGKTHVCYLNLYEIYISIYSNYSFKTKPLDNSFTFQEY